MLFNCPLQIVSKIVKKMPKSSFYWSKLTKYSNTEILFLKEFYNPPELPDGIFLFLKMHILVFFCLQILTKIVMDYYLLQILFSLLIHLYGISHFLTQSSLSWIFNIIVNDRIFFCNINSQFRGSSTIRFQFVERSW